MRPSTWRKSVSLRTGNAQMETYQFNRQRLCRFALMQCRHPMQRVREQEPRRIDSPERLSWMQPGELPTIGMTEWNLMFVLPNNRDMVSVSGWRTRVRLCTGPSPLNT